MLTIGRLISGALKMQDWKIQDWILADQIAGLENAGLEFVYVKQRCSKQVLI